MAQETLDHNDRVVFADRSRGLVQEVGAEVDDLSVRLPNMCLGLLPVVAPLSPGKVLLGVFQLSLERVQIRQVPSRRGAKVATPRSIPTNPGER